jgi:hypothetical protein
MAEKLFVPPSTDVETVADGPGTFVVPPGVRGHPTPNIPLTIEHDLSDQRGLRVRLSRISGQTPKNVLRTPIWLPAVLGDQEIEEVATFVDQVSHRAGEFSYPAGGGAGARMLRTFPFEFLTLDWRAPWLQKFQNPDWVVGQLQRIIRSKRPVHLLGTLNSSPRRRPTEFRAHVTFRSLRRVLRPGEADTRYISLETKEWRSTHGSVRATTPGKRYHFPLTHKLTAKDTLESLAKHYYGRSSLWRTIANANGLRSWGPRTAIVKHKRFKVGSKIKIPPKPDDSRTLTGTGTGQGSGQATGGGFR